VLAFITRLAQPLDHRAGKKNLILNNKHTQFLLEGLMFSGLIKRFCVCLHVVSMAYLPPNS